MFFLFEVVVQVHRLRSRQGSQDRVGREMQALRDGKL